MTRTNLRTENMSANAVYPSWHPAGRYVAFSSNRTVQGFHMRPESNIDVYDLFSSLVVYDVERNEMFACTEKDFFIVTNDVQNIELLLQGSPNNKRAFEYKMARMLLEKDFMA